MNKIDIRTSLINHFKSDPLPISYESLVQKLRLARRDKAELKKELERMVDSGELGKRKGRFFAMAPKTLKKITPKGSSPNKYELLEGKFDATPLSRNQSFAFVRTAEGDFFIDSEDSLNAFHNDLVAIEPIYRGNNKDKAIIRKIIRRDNQRMAGDIKYLSGRPIFICTNPKIHRWFEVTDTLKAKENEKVVFEVSNWGNQYSGKLPFGKVIEVLGPSGDAEVELLAVIKQFQLPLEFPDSVLSEVQELNPEILPQELSYREDLRELFTFTIDPASAKDFDDAISVEASSAGYKLWVHIADVSHYVSLDSQIFKEAAKRGNSFYFPKQVIPMLPALLSNQICSLRPNEDKLCLSVFTHFDPKGNIKNQKMVQSVIRSDFRLAYEQVDELYEGQKTQLSPTLIKALNDARKLSALLSQKRLSEGYIFFDLPEIRYEYDEGGFLNELDVDIETQSHKLIENFMLVANEYVASRLSQLSPSTLYRIHQNPEPLKLERLGLTLSHYGLCFDPHEDPNLSLQYLLNSMPNKDYHMVFDRMVLRSLKKAKYSTEHFRHFGLGMQYYTHFTSPIRRLCDLCVHHLCKSQILKSSKNKLNDKLLKLYAEVANEQELLADEAERTLERILSLSYMKNKIGEKHSGIVISTKLGSIFVRLTEIPITAILKTDGLKGAPFIYDEQAMMFVNRLTGYYYQLLDQVIVEIVEVSDDIYLELAQVPDAHVHPPLAQSPKTRNKSKTIKGKELGKSKRKGIDLKRVSAKSVRSYKKAKRKR